MIVPSRSRKTARRSRGSAIERRALGVAIERERRLKRGKGELVGSHGAGEGVLATRVDHRRLAEQDAGLWPAEQLVAAEDHEVDFARERVADTRLAAQSPGR